jgi:hypothetical protein
MSTLLVSPFQSHGGGRCMDSLAGRWITSACWLVLLLLLVRSSKAQEPKDEKYPVFRSFWQPLRVTEVGPSGTIRLEPAEVSSPLLLPDWWTVAEGHYLVASPQVLPGPMPSQTPRQLDSLVRIEVIDVGEKNTLTAKSGAEAARTLKSGDIVALARPKMTTAQIRALPMVVPLLKAHNATVPKSFRNSWVKAEQAANLSQSINHLKQIGLAMHNFDAANGNFPPAIVFGPDGKPWHSWRVLILPYLGETQLFNRYDFTQPWDSPKNRPLIGKMPSVYRDPQNGDASGSITHYAALVGEKTVFPPSGSRITITNGTASAELCKGIRLVSITDGSSNTIAVVPVDPARKIPWIKPEDITVGNDFSGLGQPGGIFSPAEIEGVGIAPVLFVDGSVQTLSARTDLATLRALATIRGGEIIDRTKLVGPSAIRRPSASRIPVLHLIRDGQTVSAWVEPAAVP